MKKNVFWKPWDERIYVLLFPGFSLTSHTSSDKGLAPSQSNSYYKISLSVKLREFFQETCDLQVENFLDSFHIQHLAWSCYPCLWHSLPIVFVFKNVLAVLGPLHFHTSFSISLSTFIKKLMGIQIRLSFLHFCQKKKLSQISVPQINRSYCFNVFPVNLFSVWVYLFLFWVFFFFSFHI